MDSGPEDHVDRLGEAVDAYLEYELAGKSEDVEAFLARHEELRDLLEPMLEEAGVDGAASEELGDASSDTTRHLAGYRIVREVGRGGMGVVYEAIEEALDRRVALKVLSSDLASVPRAIDRFRKEASAIAGLRHDAILPIYAVGDAECAHYFAMEFIEGRGLDEAIEAGGDGFGVVAGAGRVREATEIVSRIAEALDYVHGRGVVHRDVKPHNIMVARDGRVQLVDFGLAHVPVKGKAGFAGTPHYMSPEQARGDQDLDGRSDQFSLGVVLYELLTGFRPFDGSTAAAILATIQHTTPDFLALRRRGVPRDLENVCRKALEKRPEDRYASAGDFAADLRRFLRHEVVQAVTPTLWRRAQKFARRRPRTIAASSAALLLLLALGFSYASMRASQVEREGEDLGRQRRAVAQLLELARVSDLAERPRQTRQAREHLERTSALCRELIEREGERVPLELHAKFAGHASQAGRFFLELREYERARAHFAAADASYEVLERKTEKKTRVWSVHRLLARKNVALAGSESEALATCVRELRALRAKCRAQEAPIAQAALAATRASSAFVHLNATRKPQEAWAQIEEAHELWRGAPDSALGAGRGFAFASAQHTRARIASTIGKYAAAETSCELGLAHLDKRSASAKKTRAWRSLRASLLKERARAKKGSGQDEAAIEAFRVAREARAALARDFVEHVEDRVEVAQMGATLASLLVKRRKYKDGFAAYQRAATEVEGVSSRRARRLRATIDYSLSRLMRRARRPAKQIEAQVSAARKGFESLLAEDPDDVDTLRHFGVLCTAESMYALGAREHELAIRRVREAIGYHKRVLAKSAENPVTRAQRRTQANYLARALVPSRAHAEIFAAAADMVDDLPGDPVACMHAASFASLAIRVLRVREGLEPAARAATETSYVERAVAWLGMAVERGFSVDKVLGSKGLELLRTTDAFRAFEASARDKRR